MHLIMIHQNEDLTALKNKRKCEKKSSLLSKAIRYSLMSVLREQNPNPQSELKYSNPFELLCAVVLSAQATDASVNKATPALFKVAPTPELMCKLGAEGIAPYIKTIGLWRNKAKNLQILSQILYEKYNSQVPDTYEELIKLPGVGSKTAKVVLNVAFKKPYIAVDTHIFRVCNRTGLCVGKTVKEVEDNLPALIDKEFIQDAHHYILLHGRYVCKAQRPQCSSCVIREYCKSYPLVKE